MNDLDKIDDLMLAQYLADKYDLTELPNFVKRNLTIKEQLKAAQEDRKQINAICIVPRRHRRT
jgi:hypothetical protein